MFFTPVMMGIKDAVGVFTSNALKSIGSGHKLCSLYLVIMFLFCISNKLN